MSTRNDRSSPRPPKLALQSRLLTAAAFVVGLVTAIGGYAAAQSDPTPAVTAHDHGSHAAGGAAASAHSAAMALVADDIATNRAVTDGAWSSPATWGGAVPTDGARVVIPEGRTVTVDGMVSARVETVGVYGTLRFATDRNTELLVDTLVSSPQGHIEIGTPAEPIAANVVARVVFIDDGPIDRSVDPTQVGRGAVLHGMSVMHGADVTHRATLAEPVRAGATQVRLNGPLTGWGPGDQIAITGTQGPTSDEVRVISQVAGNTVQFTEPLTLDHVPPRADLSVWVANMSRNIIFESENATIARRGHVMFMHTHAVDVANVRFDHLGRTDKSIPLDDVNFGESAEEGGNQHDGSFTLGPANNIRSRYSVHVHRGGTDPDSAAARIAGSVVFDDPGWAFVNHSSHVDFIDNVSYRAQGVGFMTEAGDEVGSMVGNIAIRSVMPNFEFGDLGAIDPDIRSEVQDFGFQGDGFWLQGNRVAVVNNVAAGSSAHGIIFWSEGLLELAPDPNVATNSTIAVSTLPDPSLVPDRDRLEVWWAPLAEVRNNESYGAIVGFRSRYVHGGTYLQDLNPPPAAYIETLAPVIDGLVIWDVRDGVLLNYNERLSLRNADIIGTGAPFDHNLGQTAAIGVGVDVGNEVTLGPAFMENVRVSGFEMGLIGPRNGEWALRDLALANVTDLLIHETHSATGRVLDMDRLAFDGLSGTAVAGRDAQRRNVVMDPAFGEVASDPTILTAPDVITVDDQRVYFDAQGIDVVLTAELLEIGDHNGSVCAALEGGFTFRALTDEDDEFEDDEFDEDESEDDEDSEDDDESDDEDESDENSDGDESDDEDEDSDDDGEGAGAALVGCTNAQIASLFGAGIGGSSFSPDNVQLAPWLSNGVVETGDGAVVPVLAVPQPAPTGPEPSAVLCAGEPVTVDISLGEQPTAGDDVILGTDAADRIAAGAGNDIVCGMGGDDQIWGQAGNDLILGGDGADSLRGGNGDDELRGGPGADDLNGSRGNDVVRGEEGDDRFVRGGTGDDRVSGGPGHDAIVAGNGGSDQVMGDAGDDLVTGGPRPDMVDGGDGDDLVRGLGGADQVFGGAGNDRLFGGKQRDDLDGGDGVDACSGGTTGVGAVESDTATACEGSLISVP